jgi:hypothetical protein
MKLIGKFVLCATAAIGLVWTIATEVSAQAGYNGPTAERNRDEGDRDLEDRIANRRLLAALDENRRADSKGHPYPKLAIKQLQEDFTRLQIVNKELVLTTARNTDVDFKFVGKSTADINKRALRLLSNLALPKADENIQPPKTEEPSDASQLKSSVTALGWLIYKFAKNPMFKEADVIEPHSAAEARRSLEQIIVLSDQIKRSSDRLSKSSDQKNN